MSIEIVSLTPDQIKPVPDTFEFGKTFTNRMFTQRYTEGKGWHSAKIGPYEPFQLDPASAVFHYAQEYFEGCKAYRRPDGNINLFRTIENAKRFNSSGERMSAPAVDPEFHFDAIAQLVKLEHDWVPSGAGQSLYLRPTMIATEPALGVRTSSEYIHFVICAPVGSYFGEQVKPIPVYIADKYRRAVKGGTGNVKAGGNYSASLIALKDVKSRGYTDVLWLDAIHGKYLEEVGSMNIFYVEKGKKLVTPELSGSILPGITRRSVMQLAQHFGYEVEEKRIHVNNLIRGIKSGRITEMFGTGTAAVVAPVGRIGFGGEDYLINNEEFGPVAKRLLTALTDIQYGRAEDIFNWTHTIKVN